MIQDFQALEQKITTITNPQKVAIVKAANRQTLESILELVEKGILVPYLIDQASELKKLLKEMDVQNNKFHIIDVASDEEAAYKAVELVRENKADFIMKGNLQTSTLLKEVVNRETGIRKRNVLSHLALISVPTYPKLLGVTDGGMLLSPDVNQKEEIIHNALEVMAALGYAQPKFAVLSATETVQQKLQASTDAAELTERFEKNSTCIVEGPISLDLAINPSVAIEKNYEGHIQGDADVLITPDIVAGNTLSKSMLLLGKGAMAGLILGAQVPIVLTSRSSSAEEKKYSLLLALQMSYMQRMEGVPSR